MKTALILFLAVGLSTFHASAQTTPTSPPLPTASPVQVTAEKAAIMAQIAAIRADYKTAVREYRTERDLIRKKRAELETATAANDTVLMRTLKHELKDVRASYVLAKAKYLPISGRWKELKARLAATP